MQIILNEQEYLELTNLPYILAHTPSRCANKEIFYDLGEVLHWYSELCFHYYDVLPLE